MSSTIPFHPSLKPYTLPPATFIQSRPHIGRILCSSILFHPSSSSSPLLTLLLRRSPSDYFPLLWETPGGSLDSDSDTSIIEAAVRELKEETGLRAEKALACIAVPELMKSQASPATTNEKEDAYNLEDGGQVLTFPEPGAGWSWAKMTFLMEVEGGDGDVEVVLQPEEHVDYRWATEEEIVEGRFKAKEGDEVTGDEEEISFVSEAVRLAVLEAFRVKKEMMAT